MAINVLIVDDSAVVRQVLTQQIDGVQGIRVIGAATDPLFAMKKMAVQWPDVIILDIEMPRMDGITFLKKIMTEHPTPVVICSTLTERGAAVTMEAMASGAVDIITKPRVGLKDFLSEHKAQMVDAIRAAAMARVGRGRPAAARTAIPPPAASPKLNADAVLASSSKPMSETTDRVVAIGTSTGGTQALERVLRQLPRTAPGIVVVQHMPEQFTAAFAQRLDSVCQLTVKEAEMGDRVMPGLVLIANGGRHLLLRRSGAQYRVELKDGPLISRHRPSVDVLFRSVANAAGPNALGVIMTGMGDDGAHGLREMHDAGAYTIGQNEQTCVVYGMPKEAMKAGAVDIEVGIDEIPRLILKHGAG